MGRQKHLEVQILRCLRRLSSPQSVLRSLMPRSRPSWFSPFRPFPLLMSLRALRLILLGLPRKGMSLRVMRLILLSLPKKWPKQN